MNKRTQQLVENCDAISELIGELLIVVIAVLTFGVITVHVLTYQGPVDTAYIDIDGWMDSSTDTIYLRHSGGEVVGTEDLKIIVNLDGTRCELSSDDITAILGSSTWQLADIIAVNASDVWGVGINEDTEVDASIVHIGLSTTMGNGVLPDRRTGGSGEPPAPTPTPTPTPTPPDPGLVSLWHLDENTGSTAHDSIGCNDGVITGATWTTGVNGSALLFDGKDDCINCGNDGSLNITDEITIVVWVNASSQKTANIIGKGGNSKKNAGYRISLDDTDGWVCEVYYGSKPKKCKVNWGEGQATLNQWYHVAMTYNGSALQLYVDGVAKNSKSASGSLNINSRNLYIGSNDAKKKVFDGVIDEVAIYNRTLTAEEIAELKEQY